MLRYLACLIGFFAIIAVLPARGEAPLQQAPIQQQALLQEGLASQKQNPAEARPSGQIQTAQTPERQAGDKLSNSSKSNDSGGAPNRIVGLVGGIVGGILLLVLFVSLIAWQWHKTPQAKDDDKALEELRIIYGFWLIVAALVIALLVLIVTLTAISPDTNKASDIVAIAGTVTGLITTLTAAFFGIQQAGAGRSQALMPRTRSIAIQSERTRRRSPRALTSPANWIALPNSSNFSVRVVLPASGCEMIAKVPGGHPLSGSWRELDCQCFAPV
jgi:hypothetical protein